MDLATFREMVENSSLNEEWIEFRAINGYFTVDSKTYAGEVISVTYSNEHNWWVERYSLDNDYLAQYGAGDSLEQAIFNFNC